MTQEERKHLHESMTKVEMDIMQAKSHDYAKDEDILSNFKLSSKISGHSVAQVIMSEITKKDIRLNNLQNRDKILNESVLDTIIDMRNYLFLLYCALKETKSV